MELEVQKLRGKLLKSRKEGQRLTEALSSVGHEVLVVSPDRPGIGLLAKGAQSIQSPKDFQGGDCILPRRPDGGARRPADVSLVANSTDIMHETRRSPPGELTRAFNGIRALAGNAIPALFFYNRAKIIGRVPKSRLSQRLTFPTFVSQATSQCRGGERLDTRSPRFSSVFFAQLSWLDNGKHWTDIEAEAWKVRLGGADYFTMQNAAWRGSVSRLFF